MMIKFYWHYLLRLHVAQNTLQLPFLFSSSLSLSCQCFWRKCQKFFREVLRSVTKEACDQDMTYSLYTPKNISVRIVPRLVIGDACGTWYDLFAVTSIHSIQKSTKAARSSETS